MKNIFTVNKTSNRLAWGTIAIVLFSTIHHIYGGLEYNTSWRIIMPIFFFLPMLIITLLLQSLILKVQNKFIISVYVLIVIVGWIGILGIGEGGYNHVVKNVMYFTGASESIMSKMYPSEFGGTKLFEKPNNWFFEISGILTTLFGLYIAYYLKKLIQFLRNISAKQTIKLL